MEFRPVLFRSDARECPGRASKADQRRDDKGHPAPADGRRLVNFHALIGPRIERGLDAPGNKAVYLGEQRLTLYVRVRPLGGGIGGKEGVAERRVRKEIVRSSRSGRGACN